MAHLYVDLTPSTKYYDKKSGLTREEWYDSLQRSSTLYVGNLSFYTTVGVCSWKICTKSTTACVGDNTKTPRKFLLISVHFYANSDVKLYNK